MPGTARATHRATSSAGDGPGALVTLTVGDEVLLARITQRSVQAMGLAVGQSCFALVKSMAVARHQVGREDP